MLGLVALLRSRMVLVLDRAIVILARHLLREVSVGTVCNIRHRVKIYSMAYVCIYAILLVR